MNPKEILDKIENLIENKLSKSDISKTKIEETINNHDAKNIFLLTLQFFLSIVKSPFKFISKYLKDEIIIAMKKDGKLYALIFGIMATLFVFLSILWLFISVAIGVYFLEKGNSMFISVTYSIIFQVISIIIISLIAFFATRGLESLKMFKKLKKYK